MASIAVVIMMAAALAALTGGLTRAIVRDIRQADGFRAQLGARLEGLRLRRMLEYLAIDPRSYVYDQPALAIETQMARCRACACSELCDNALQGNAVPARLAFCPNHAALTTLAR